MDRHPVFVTAGMAFNMWHVSPRRTNTATLNLHKKIILQCNYFVKILKEAQL